MSDEFFREDCLEWHAKAVRKGYFLAARALLRNALKFRRGGRAESLAVGYVFCNGKLLWYHWGN